METCVAFDCYDWVIKVLTVPMRNGNVQWMQTHHHCLGSYRTYEEWKQSEEMRLIAQIFQFLPYLWGMETFWNTTNFNNQRWFLPYLWGMETSCLCFNAYHPPMSSYRTYEEWKPREQKKGAAIAAPCSYRTYEEWKLSSSPFFEHLSFCSYRTYEEWKLIELST